jgi:hypothetical protein
MSAFKPAETPMGELIAKADDWMNENGNHPDATVIALIIAQKAIEHRVKRGIWSTEVGLNFAYECGKHLPRSTARNLDVPWQHPDRWLAPQYLAIGFCLGLILAVWLL